ncbi:hypothetical protein LTR78_006493 [Recurvomyces mirabilis]|uniref:Uncharacterized protein n=1 Tax=Recurvomyces mirabilis TaxID=574656 RepID=A0AAE0WKW6_9PEZI|nr:hypothetical protein LTR78_006493 [Recurvomyces mirabilis]KAK5151089.1 hypothetical protein LTS14_009584 [Recurvomyces mirabilis]
MEVVTEIVAVAVATSAPAAEAKEPTSTAKTYSSPDGPYLTVTPWKFLGFDREFIATAPSAPTAKILCHAWTIDTRESGIQAFTTLIISVLTWYFSPVQSTNERLKDKSEHLSDAGVDDDGHDRKNDQVEKHKIDPSDRSAVFALILFCPVLLAFPVIYNGLLGLHTAAKTTESRLRARLRAGDFAIRQHTWTFFKVFALCVV